LDVNAGVWKPALSEQSIPAKRFTSQAILHQLKDLYHRPVLRIIIETIGSIVTHRPVLRIV